MIKKGALPHSMLFSGPVDSGKFNFALKLMMALNCNENPGGTITPCDSCRNCRRIKKLNFPDFLVVEAEGKQIKVDRIRELKTSLTLKPYEAAKRIVLIKNANLLGVQSGNALLKILEEPPSNTHFILTAENYMDILPTIRSRCHNFRFLPFKNLKKSHADYFSLEKILSAGKEKTTDTRDNFYKLIQILLNPKKINSGVIIFISQYLCAKKENIELFFETFLIFFRDILVYKTTGKNTLIFELNEHTMENPPKIKNENIFKITDIIFTSIERLKGNVNSKLLIESSLLKIQAIINER